MELARAQRHVDELSEALAKARPDVVVVIGDDQRELFGTDGTPAIGLFTGEEVWDLPPSEAYLARVTADIQAAGWASHAGERDRYPAHAALAAHLASRLTGSGFDLSLLSTRSEGRGLGHAFTFVRRRLRLSEATPIVPILLNTSFPPNVPSARRCYLLGEAIRDGITSFAGDERVAVVASGGLSHVVVLDTFDRKVLTRPGRRGGARDASRGSPPVGDLRDAQLDRRGRRLPRLRLRVVDYIPAYRSPAGTGVGMAFGLWQPRAAEAEPQAAR